MKHGLIALGLALMAPTVVPTDSPDLVLDINGADSGLVFEGIGALHGPPTRLLVDYPEPQRGQVLDYLFKPGYGASLQHVKHDMGSDGNAGTGSEAATKHERDDESFNRGYAWWLLTEAKKRNPNIRIGLLQAAPGWVGGFFTQENLDNIINYVKGAKRHHGVEIDNVAGTVNEPSVVHQKVDWDWVKRLRAELAKEFIDERYPGRHELVIGSTRWLAGSSSPSSRWSTGGSSR